MSSKKTHHDELDGSTPSSYQIQKNNEKAKLNLFKQNEYQIIR